MASITTIGTVHQGTRSAQAALGLLPSSPTRISPAPTRRRYNSTFVGAESRNKVTCARLEATPKDGSSAYAKRIVSIEIDQARVQREARRQPLIRGSARSVCSVVRALVVVVVLALLVSLVSGVGARRVDHHRLSSPPTPAPSPRNKGTRDNRATTTTSSTAPPSGRLLASRRFGESWRVAIDANLFLGPSGVLASSLRHDSYGGASLAYYF